MAWPKKKVGKTEWRVETIDSGIVTARLQRLAADKWLVKYVYWDGVEPGRITIISMQSAAYAPKKEKDPKL